MIVNKELVEIIAIPAAVISCDGYFIYSNHHFQYLFDRIFEDQLVENIKILDKDFDCSNVDFGNSVQKVINLKLLKIKCHLFKVEYQSEVAILYVVDNILFNKEIIKILNHIGDIIDITNSDGVIELINDAVYELTELDKESISIGTSLMEKHAEGLLSEPAFYSVMKEKKPIIKRVKYSTGRTLLNRGYPVLSDEGKIEKVIIFGQDISQLTALEERVILSENNGEMILEFDQVDQYFKDNNLVYSSNSIKKIVNTAIKIAPTNSSVFVWGESGVGKEMIAKIIHNISNRKNKPFVAINCSAIPHDLFESELFGYEQGSFTGANKFGKRGLLEEADGGTIFLDEVCEMPYSLQSKLLRVIQEGKVRRVGGVEDKTIDVRYISATNLKLDEVLNNGKFRTDLYYRLSVIPIFIPPLRERKEDIVILIKHYLDYFNVEFSKSISFSQVVIKKMIEYGWPGNVRELRNLIQRIILLSETNYVKDIDMNFFGLVESRCDDQSKAIIVNSTLPLKKAVNIVENCLINKVYKETSSIVKTAEILEINPSTIHRKIKNGEIFIQE